MSQSNSRYRQLFEPLPIGPVVAPNRFYQVPHCTGMGYQRPRMLAAMREVKAEGGWGVVCTEYCSIHDSSDSSHPHASLRDAVDVKNMRVLTEGIHRHGSLAGVELWYGGHSNPNYNSREISLDVGSLNQGATMPLQSQSRAMTETDISYFRNLHKQAVVRAIEANFDIIYVYANHGYLINNFLDRDLNKRTDAYGGSPLNRVRLLAELIQDAKDIAKNKAAIAVRYSISEDIEADASEMLDCFNLIAEMPDLWDITVDNYGVEMGSSRFVREATQQNAIGKIKSLTTKPVVGVGRFTSPETMLQQLKSGTQDLIGAARPSIADPFLPNKIKNGREDEIRECIGCNVCYAHDSVSAPIRCTQNPTMAEEWRRGWHPERVLSRHADESVLIVGAGPAGLEAACTLGKRGYQVTLADANRELGGRVIWESRLPGFSEWARVKDWRINQLSKLPNVGVFPESKLDIETILELACQNVVIATGSNWRRDGQGRWLKQPFKGHTEVRVKSVEDVCKGQKLCGHVAIFDDDHYYLGGAIALLLANQGCRVSLISTAPVPGESMQFTEELNLTMAKLLLAGVEIIPSHGLIGIESTDVRLECVYTQREKLISVDHLVPITSRVPNDDLWHSLSAMVGDYPQESLNFNLYKIGDCEAPGIIAAAVYSGHKLARELGEKPVSALRDRVEI